MQELQAAEMPFNRHLKPPEEIGLWFAEKVIANCRKHDGAILLAERRGRLRRLCRSLHAG